MVQVVLDDVPDDPLARERLATPDELLAEVGGGPALQAVLDQSPGALQPFFQLGGVRCGWPSSSQVCKCSSPGSPSPMMLWNHQTRAAMMCAAMTQTSR